MGQARGRRFRIAATAYACVVVILLGLSFIAPVWFFVAEIATMPLGILWFTGGASIALAVASLLGWAGPVVFFGSFVASALLNAVLLDEATQAIRRCDRGPMRAAVKTILRCHRRPVRAAARVIRCCDLGPARGRRRQAACQSSASLP